jgi:hypothetical protein
VLEALSSCIPQGFVIQLVGCVCLRNLGSVFSIYNVAFNLFVNFEFCTVIAYECVFAVFVGSLNVTQLDVLLMCAFSDTVSTCPLDCFSVRYRLQVQKQLLLIKWRLMCVRGWTKIKYCVRDFRLPPRC